MAEVADRRGRRPRRGRQPADGVERRSTRRRSSSDATRERVRAGDRRARLPPARRGADAAHAPQFDHRHPSRSVLRRDLGRRARPVRARAHRAGERAGHARAHLQRAQRRGGDRAPRRPRRRRRDRRGRHHRHVLRRPAHRLAARARRAVRLVRHGRGAATTSTAPLTPGSTSTARPARGRPRAHALSIAGPRVALPRLADRQSGPATTASAAGARR